MGAKGHGLHTHGTISPHPSSLQPAGSSGFVLCWAGCLQDERSGNSLLLPVSQWGDDHRHQRCSVGLDHYAEVQTCPCLRFTPGLEPQLLEGSSVTGSPGSWVWSFWSRTRTLQTFGRAGVGEEELSGVLAMGHVESVV